LTMLYRSTDRLCRRGAPMQNLAHSASFESLDKDAPSKAGTKQLGDLEETYDIVFTVRCLINLNEVALQKQAVSTLASRVRPGGYLLMIENSMASYRKQNECREFLGLSPRQPAAFNLFFDESEIRPHIAHADLELIDVEDFSSLHDLMLYVLLPSISEGQVDYAHPLVRAAAALSERVFSREPGAFGDFGQNRLFVCFKPE
jgi:hypothetical protein